MTETAAALRHKLIHAAQRWALGGPLDHATTTLRHRAIRATHQHYRANIPAYTRLCAEEQLGDDADLSAIAGRLTSTDDLFKSYNPLWLEHGDFAQMTAWLGAIHHARPAVDLTGVTDVDGWVERLRAAGLRPVVSSGTSGTLSFVPRDAANWALTRTVNTACVLPQIARRIGGWQGAVANTAGGLLGPQRFEQLTRRLSPRGYEVILLDFRRGGSGMQSIGMELAAAFTRATFLYELDLPLGALQRIARGPRTPEDRALLTQIQQVTVTDREQNYARVLDAAAAASAAGRRVLMFGAPFQLKDLCGYAAATGRQAALRPGSLVLFGGGWKSFSGEQIPRDELVRMVCETFQLPEELVCEGYSMTEINVMLLRCAHGRFHIPPVVEPLLFDQALTPRAAVGRGVFGFLDPLAVAYPGFVVTGDEVELAAGGCACGLHGPAITSIARAGRRELKGCGGIMAAVRA